MTSTKRFEPIADATQMGRVGLYVSDLERSFDYYGHRIGLKVVRESNESAGLGVDGKELLVLYEKPGLQPVAKGHTGLYHYALLVPSRKALGHTLRQLLATETRIDGASDHGVSEALYLTDPDGHGIEIYRDRKRAEWPREGQNVRMTVDPLDAEGLLATAEEHPISWTGLEVGTKMGHVHLHVQNLARSETFYHEYLGFSIMQRFSGSASFLSAGGYHHHLGINIWAGVDAPPPADEAARLAWFEIVLPLRTELQKIVERLHDAQVGLEATRDGWSLTDPSGNRLVLRT